MYKNQTSFIGLIVSVLLLGCKSPPETANIPSDPSGSHLIQLIPDLNPENEDDTCKVLEGTVIISLDPNNLDTVSSFSAILTSQEPDSNTPSECELNNNGYIYIQALLDQNGSLIPGPPQAASNWSEPPPEPLKDQTLLIIQPPRCIATGDSETPFSLVWVEPNTVYFSGNVFSGGAWGGVSTNQSFTCTGTWQITFLEEQD